MFGEHHTSGFARGLAELLDDEDDALIDRGIANLSNDRSASTAGMKDMGAHLCYGESMKKATTIDPVLEFFHSALTTLYGPALDRVVLCGSRARGDVEPDSDYDVAVFLKDVSPGMAECYRLADLRTRFLEAGGPFFDAIPFRASAYHDRTPIMDAIRRDGLIL